MWDILHKIFVEIGITFVSVCHIRALIKEDWEVIKPVRLFIERRLKQRRQTMATPLATKIAEGFQVLNIALANAPKILADVAAAEAAEKDPVAEMAALSQLLADVQPAVNSLIALVPPPPVAA